MTTGKHSLRRSRDALGLGRRSVTLPIFRKPASVAILESLPRARGEPGESLVPEEPRPQTHGACENTVRPCPWAGCRYHLAIEVNKRTGSMLVTFPDLEIEEMAETCALDVADRGGTSLEEIGALLNMTRERVRQIEHIAKEKLAHADPTLSELVWEEHASVDWLPEED